MISTSTCIPAHPDVNFGGAEWQACTYRVVWHELQRHRPAGRPLVIGIDGRSGSGKTTLATRLNTQKLRTTLIHTDDIAWHHSFFGWVHLLVDELLEPFHDGRAPKSYTPRAWVRHGRTGAITIPSDTSTLIVEGVGAAAREVRRLLDVVIWVDASEELGRQRVLARGVDSPDFIDDWLSEENAFLGEHRPWEAADLWVRGDSVDTSEHSRTEWRRVFDNVDKS